MIMENYEVSVVIPTLNRIETLPRALESVINQSYKPSEIIVVDNGSSDGTLEFLGKNFPSVTILEEKKLGVSAARNKGIKHSTFQWVALLDSDDEWFLNKLEGQIDVLKKSSNNYRLSHTDEVWIKNGKQLNQMKKHKKIGGDIFDKCLSICCISPSSVLIHKSLFDELGYFDETLPVCEDYDLWLKFCSKENVHFINKKLILKYGGHSDQLSKAYWGMDRFRVKCIENLIFNYDLKSNQRQKAIKSLIKKIKIILNGAYKRNNSSIIVNFEKKLLFWEEQK